MSDELEQTTELDLDKAGEDIMDGVLGEDRERPEPVEEVVEEKKPDTTSEPTATNASPSQPANTAPVANPAETQSPTSTAPRTWRPEAAAHWNELPPQVQAEIQKREQDIFNGLNQYKQFANIGQRAFQAVKDVLPVLQQQGQDPYAFMRDMCEVHRLLSAGTPEQKARAFTALALHYGVATDQNGATSPLPDQMEMMRQQIANLTNFQAQSMQQQQLAQQQYCSQQIEAMAADKENAPYFDEAVPMMTELINKGLANDLKEAYNNAIWLVPSIRAKLQATTSQAMAEAGAAKVAAAGKMAAANVKGSQRAGSETTMGSMDDTLWEALRDIKSR